MYFCFREEVIEYYSKLSAEAAKREQRALWRIRRHRHDQQRIELILAEEDSLRQAMNLRSRVSILPAGKNDSVTKAIQTDTEAISDDTKAIQPDGTVDSSATPAISATDQVIGPVEGTAGASVVTESDVIASGDKHSHSDRTEDQDGLENQGSSNTGRLASNDQADISGQQKTKADSTPAVGTLISLDQSSLATGHLANEDIESTLTLIQGDSKRPGASAVDTAGTRPTGAPLNLLDFSIGDFLPKDSNNDDEEKAYINPEAEVEDVLVEIGSSLPTGPKMDDDANSAAANILDDLLGTSSSNKPNSDVEESGGNSDGSAADMHQRGTTRGHASDSNFTVGQVMTGDGEKMVKKSAHGHATDSVFAVGQEITIDDSKMAPKNEHGHSSDSNFSLGQEITIEDTRTATRNEHGHTSDSNFVFGQEITLIDAQVPKNAHGHSSDSNFTVGKEIGQDDVQNVASNKNVHGHSSDMSEDVRHEPKSRNIHGHASESHLTSGGQDGDDEVKMPMPSVHGHSSDSTAGQALYGEGDVASMVKPSAGLYGHSSDSTAGGVMYPSDGVGRHVASDSSADVPDAVYTADSRRLLAHGHSSDSTVQDMMYPASQEQLQKQLPAPPDGDGGGSGARRKLGANAGSHPSYSTAQRFMYNRNVLGGDQQVKQATEEPAAKSEAAVWAGDGVEQFQDVFDMFGELYL